MRRTDDKEKEEPRKRVEREKQKRRHWQIEGLKQSGKNKLLRI